MQSKNQEKCDKKTIRLDKGAFTYDVRFFGVIFDLPTYPNQISSDVA